MNNPIRDEEIALVEQIVNRLGENFDAVQILCSRANADGNTEILSRGNGNYFARVGMCREFLENDSAATIGSKINVI